MIFAYEEESRGGAGLGRVTGLMKSLRPREFKGVVSVAESSPVPAGALGRRAVAFSLAGFVARLPMSMTGIGIVLLVSLTTGSFGQAGLLIAAAALAGAAVAPLWGRATDRVGQARVLLVTVLINVLSVALLVTAIELGWPLAVGWQQPSAWGLVSAWPDQPYGRVGPSG